MNVNGAAIGGEIHRCRRRTVPPSITSGTSGRKASDDLARIFRTAARARRLPRVQPDLVQPGSQVNATHNVCETPCGTDSSPFAPFRANKRD